MARDDDKEALSGFVTLASKLADRFGTSPRRAQLTFKSDAFEASLVLDREDGVAPAKVGKAAHAMQPLWNKPGHSIIARIAENVLEDRSPARKHTLDQILQADSLSRNTFAIAARWPDDNKSDAAFHARTGPWHYVDRPWTEGQSMQPLPALPAGPNAVSRLVEIQDELVTSTGDDQVTAICFVLHLVGDLHQPLHCITHVDTAHPAPGGDRGGNAFQLGHGFRDLHSYWDSLLTKASDPTDTYLTKKATEITNAYPDDDATFPGGVTSVLDPSVWADESYRLAVANAYADIAPGFRPTADTDYAKRAAEVARRQAALGGYRLARMLEELVDRLP